MNIRTILILFILLVGASLQTCPSASADNDETDETVTIIADDDTGRIFEYRQNGLLMMIKVIPKVGRPYYLVPADGQPHFTDLTEKRHLFPQWTLIEW
ncbi:MAG: DUF2782 domain-containing protein [Pseudomonadales bacterium]